MKGLSKIVHFRILLVLSLLGISGRLEAQVHLDALLDSLESETYIAREIRLQEVEVLGKADPKEAFLLRYYKSNNLASTEDVLSRLSGMSVIRRGNYAWEPIRHGLNSSQINVSIDGMQIFGACTDKMDPVTSYVEPNNLESISINQHESAFEYGSNIGGGLNLSLRKPVFNSFSISAGTRYESVSNGFGGLFSLNKGNRKLATRISGSYRKSNDYRTGDGDRIFHSGFNKFNLSVGTAYRIKENRLLSMDLLFDDAWDIGYPALPMDVEYARARILSTTYYHWDPLPGFEELEAKVYYNRIDHKMDDSRRENIPMHMDMPGETETSGAYAKLSGNVKGKHDYQLKIDGFWTRAYAEMTMFPNEASPMFMLTWPEVNRFSGGIVLKDVYQVSKKTEISSTVRIDLSKTRMKNLLGSRQLSVFGYEDYSDPLRFNPNVNLQVSHKLNNHILSAGIGYSQRLPSTAEQYGFYLYNAYDGFDYIGIPDIDNEQSITASLGHTLRKGKLELQTEVFGYFFRDYIIGLIDPNLEAMTIGANGVKVYDNISSAQLLAIDSRLLYSWNSSLSSILSLKYTYGRTDLGDPLPLIPALKTNLGMMYSLKDYRIQMDAEFAAEQNRINSDFGETPTDAYGILSLRVFRDFNFGKHSLEAGIGVENLLDATYQEHLDWGDLPRPGRNFQFTLNWKVN